MSSWLPVLWRKCIEAPLCDKFTRINYFVLALCERVQKFYLCSHIAVSFISVMDLSYFFTTAINIIMTEVE